MTLSSQPISILPDVALDLDQASLLRRIAHRIRRSIDLQEILSETAADVRSFVAMDRVKIYKFHADGSGQVVAESIHEQRLPSLLGLNFPADDIPEEARQMFMQAQVRSIIDVEYQEIGQSLTRNQETGEILFEDIRFRPVDPCHVEYLAAMGVKSSLTLPLLNQDELWGLLVAHHAEAKRFSEEELQLVQLIVDQLSMAIAQSALVEKAQARAEQEATINRISSYLHSLSTIELQAALEETVRSLQGSGGRLYVNTEIFEQLVLEHRSTNGKQSLNGLQSFDGKQSTREQFVNEEQLIQAQPSIATTVPSCSLKLYTCGSQPIMPELARYMLMEKYSVWQRHFKSEPHQISGVKPEPWAIADLYKVSNLRNLQAAFLPTKIRGILIMPLYYRHQHLGYLSVFRDEIETETLWAGQFDPDQRQSVPRSSFEVWRQLQRSQIKPWTEADVALMEAIGLHFATAIQQYEMHQQLQILNANLELQVQERTAKLYEAIRQSKEQAKQLAQTLEDLQSTQSQLIQTEKMSSLGQLVAGIAHEINNPVNFIHGNLNHITQYTEDLLRLIELYQQHDGAPHPEITALAEELDLEFVADDLPKTLSSMKLGTERIRQIVLSLRNFSRLDQAEMKLVDIHEGLESTLLILQHRFKAKSNTQGVQLLKEYGDIPAVECYPGQLNQVFMNLLSNAIDALEESKDFFALNSNLNAAMQGEQHSNREETRIQIAPLICIKTAREKAGWVTIRIADNGMGMTEEVRAKLFSVFFTTKPEGKGTGLGLSISHDIIKKHGGKLSCRSAPGEGAEFVIELPIEQSAKI